MSFAKSSFVVALLALLTGCGGAGMSTSSTRLANGAGGGAGAPLMDGPVMSSPPIVEHYSEPVDISARSAPREPLMFRIENCTRCNGGQ